MPDLRTLEKEFDKYYFNMYYDEAMQVVGKMKLNNNTSKARYCELLIYYEQGKYERVRQMLRNKKLDDVYERELYICSLLELQLYEEFFNAYRSLGEVSQYCVAYMGGLMIAQGLEIERIKELGNLNAIVEYPTFFERRYKWFVANTIAEIHLINEEKIQMIEAGMDEEDILYMRNLLNRKFESIRIIDSFREDIKDLVEADKHVEIEKVLWFPIAYCCKKSPSGQISVIQSFDSLYDIVHYLELCRKINYDCVELDGLVEYGKKLFDAIREGNAYVIELMKKIYIDVSIYKRYAIDEGDTTIADVIYSELKKYAPYVLDEIEDHSQDKKIISLLSEKGKFAYKAALWQFENSMNSNYGTTDAGMLCLSYMRILELEINERLITKLRSHKDEIIQKYKQFLDGFSEQDKDKHDKTWGFVISSISKDGEEGLELGPVYAILDILRDKKFKKTNPDFNMVQTIRSYIDKYLSEDGKKALSDGLLASMVTPKVRNKYRNPPAHTRYVRLDVALECREYVEKNLILLDSYISKDNEV